jgi:hypothetical protein
MLPNNAVPNEDALSISNPSINNMKARLLTTEQIEKISNFLANESAEKKEDSNSESIRQAYLDQREFYLKKLSPDNDTKWGGPLLDHNELDRLIGTLLSVNQNGDFDEVIRAACEAHLREPITRQSWNHSVCHNFEKYPSGLLSSDRFLDLAERLVAQGAERALRGDGCFDRILKGVIAYNLDKVNHENLYSDFIFKPKCLDSEIVQTLLDNEWYRNCLYFAQATTPYQYFLKKMEDALSQPDDKDVYASVSFSRLLLIRNEENAAIIDAYIARAYKSKAGQISGIEAWDNYRNATKREALLGVFIDVEGTILVGKYFKEEKQVRTVLNKQLVQALDALCPSKEGVTIFTGGDTIQLTEQLRTLGFPERFLPVRSKADFYGQKLQILIDDTKPEIQGFHAEAFICPDSYESSDIEKLKELDPQGALALYDQSIAGRLCQEDNL